MSATSTIVVDVNPPLPASSSATGGAGAPTQETDEEVTSLTRGLSAGRDEAFTALHTRYFERLGRYLIVVCRGDEHATAEALQETWLRVARYARVMKTEADLWRWLASLARTAAIDGSRRRTRYGAALQRYLAWFRPDPDFDPAVDEPLIRLETALEIGLADLPCEDRELLVARYRGGRSVRELADALGVSEKSLESRLFRLRTSLRRQLLERLSHEDTTD